MSSTNSFSVVAGPVVLIVAKPYESFQPVHGLLVSPLDSTTTVAARISTFVQRGTSQIVDATGKIYGPVATPVTLVSAEYSTVDESGPWTALGILSSDPAYSFPANGTFAGAAFTIPVTFLQQVSGNVWLRLRVSY